MADEISNAEKPVVQAQSWSVEWFGSQRDFIGGRATEPISLERFAGVESLYAVGPLEQGQGEISIYDSVSLIAEVQGGRVQVTIDLCRRAAFLVYAIAETWRRVTVPDRIENEQQLENKLLPFAVQSGIDIDQPFPFLVHCYAVAAGFHVLCNQSRGDYSPELHEKAKVRFTIARESVEIVGFYSRKHRGVFTPRDSDFHIHFRTLDNRLSGHLETFSFDQGMTLYLPSNER
jgi:acetolactate decarboxylase